jgi:hypothetical protein
MLTAHPQPSARATGTCPGRGLLALHVEPFDEFDLARQDAASVPAGWRCSSLIPSFDALARDFRASGYSLRHLLGRIAARARTNFRPGLTANGKTSTRSFMPASSYAC